MTKEIFSYFIKTDMIIDLPKDYLWTNCLYVRVTQSGQDAPYHLISLTGEEILWLGEVIYLLPGLLD